MSKNINSQIEYLIESHNWSLKDGRLCKQLQFKNFESVINFVNSLLPKIIESDHHPIMIINFNSLGIELFSFDENRITKKDVSMASADEVKAQTGFTIGGVSPLGHINDLNIIIDKSLERFQIVYAAAGHPNSIFKIDISKLKNLTKGRVEDITE